ncbi:MAG: putative metalloprotease CJM1_0395 family protein [Pseudomonadota bacterium]
MTVTAFIPGVGLDRSQRVQAPEPAAQAESSQGGATTADTARVGHTSEPDFPGRTRSGFGDNARENLFRSTVEPGASDEELTEEEQAQIRDLKARDTEVRRHEEAHARVGGQYAGQPTYTYQTGPDGKRYAIGGEVAIDVAPIPDDPNGTVAKMDVVIAAALAPAEPSGQDRKVAALAARQRLEATTELAEQRAEQLNGGALNREAVDLNGALLSLDAAGRTPELYLAA